MIVFEEVSKSYPGGVEALAGFSLKIEAGEILVLLGTSGSGKTTALKMVNRLVEPSAGRILVEGIDVRARDPIELRRGIGYAIQHVGLFPHLSVAENIAVVPRLLGWPGPRIAARVEELLLMVGLGPGEFCGRYPRELSGGQLQRVGVARALAAEPPIVLLDEPFGALDPITRAELQGEFLALQARLRKTVIFVTHDVFEAFRLADRIALLDAGRLRQLGPPAEIVERPADGFVTGFLSPHRFQLALLARTLGAVLPGLEPATPGEETPPPAGLGPRSPLSEAVRLFEERRAPRLPVYEGEKFLGWLTRECLLAVLARALGEGSA